MIDKDRMRYDYGPVGASRLEVDLTNPMHLRRTVRLDHEIDAALLGRAWEKTKRVYPIIDSVMLFDEGDYDYYRQDPARVREHGAAHLYFATPTEGTSVPVRSRVPIVPGSACAGHRMVALTYFGDTMVFGAYHLLLDGQGCQKVFSTLLYTYLALYTGHEDAQPIVELREGRSTQEYYVPASMEMLMSRSYEPQPLFHLPEGVHGFLDDDMVEDEGTICAGAIEMDASDFMRLCKSCGATPSAMLATLLGKANFALRPEEREGIVFNFTVSGRRELGLTDSIANIVSKAISYATREDYERLSLADISQRIRSHINQQRTLDYCVSYCKQLMETRHQQAAITRTVTYMGPFTLGDNDCHILEMGIGTNGSSNLYLFQVQDRFVLAVHYGRATQRYLDEFARIFCELGVRAEVTHPAHYVALDSDEPVL